MRIAVLVLAAVVATASATLTAGVAKSVITLPTMQTEGAGAPLAGYNHGDRRAPHWPLPEETKYTTFMAPAQGVLDDNYCKALVLDDGKGSRMAYVTMDAIGSDQTMNGIVLQKLREAGSSLNIENVIFSSSHSHSGPAAISPRLLWALAPATDLLVEKLQQNMATIIAQTILDAEANMVPAMMDVGSHHVYNATVNRRAKISPHLEPSTVDTHFGVIGINKADGSVLATVWNFAFHSVCFGPSNMKYSSDLAGRSNQLVEEQLGGIALYINADAGDVDPNRGAPLDMCEVLTPNTNDLAGGKVFAAAVAAGRKALKPSADVSIGMAFHQVDLGPTQMNITLARFDNCTQGGELDICSICEVLDCDANLHLQENWLDENPWFHATKFVVNGVTSVGVTMPGEALTNLGYQIRNDIAALGYTGPVFLYGYTNAHIGYMATGPGGGGITPEGDDEYDLGGYESQLTFFGIDTSVLIRDACKATMQKLA